MKAKLAPFFIYLSGLIYIHSLALRKAELEEESGEDHNGNLWVALDDLIKRGVQREKEKVYPYAEWQDLLVCPVRPNWF